MLNFYRLYLVMQKTPFFLQKSLGLKLLINYFVNYISGLVIFKAKR